MAQPGQLIGVSASAGLQGIDPYVGFLIEAKRGAEKKVSPKTQRAFWPFGWRHSEEPIAVAQMPKHEASPDASEDEIPF